MTRSGEKAKAKALLPPILDSEQLMLCLLLVGVGDRGVFIHVMKGHHDYTWLAIQPYRVVLTGPGRRTTKALGTWIWKMKAFQISRLT